MSHNCVTVTHDVTLHLSSKSKIKKNKLKKNEKKKKKAKKNKMKLSLLFTILTRVEFYCYDNY